MIEPYAGGNVRVRCDRQVRLGGGCILLYVCELSGKLLINYKSIESHLNLDMLLCLAHVPLQQLWYSGTIKGVDCKRQTMIVMFDNGTEVRGKEHWGGDASSLLYIREN